jgi:imidazolonepropionase-like amidohydrolase
MRKLILFITALLLLGLPALAQQKQDILIKNATILTASHGRLENTDLLIQGGKITKIGKNIAAPAGAQVIDATGKYVSPGIIDCHSHTMLDAINEGSYVVTSMTRIRDVLNPTDVDLYRALAGGVTALNVLHGSANAIGGQNSVVKIKWGHPIEDFLIPDAPPGIKFALGENPKQTHFTQPGVTPRYPRTRMGVMETIRDAFTRARNYKNEWDDYRAKVAKGDKTAIPPRKDLELDPLVEILEGKRYIHCHSYRGDEELALIHVADEFGFKIRTFQHGLEAYKIAPEIARHGAGVSIFADSWAYKIEAYDAIPYDAAILWKNGIKVSINSDSDERMRRLNLDAAKIEKYGGVPEEDALKMITWNPAWQLGIEKRTGSIDVGKDGDVVIWNTHPFSVYSHAEMTIVEGEVMFDRAKDIAGRAALDQERQALEKMDMNRAPGQGQPSTAPAIPREKKKADLDDAEGDQDNDNQ